MKLKEAFDRLRFTLTNQINTLMRKNFDANM